VNQLIDANNTVEFNEAVFKCVQSQNKMTSLSHVWATFKQIWIECLTLCLVYVTTMICYPGLILQTNLTFIEDESWFQVFMLALFSISELMGRFATKYLPAKATSRRGVILASLVRTVCVYTSIMIGIKHEPEFLFDSDWFKILNTLFIGFGNGLLGTLLMILGPYKVSNVESERAG